MSESAERPQCGIPSDLIDLEFHKDFESSKVYQRLKYAKHGIIAAVGTGQWGKTAFVHSLLQEPIFKNRNIVLVGYSDDFVRLHYPPRYRGMDWPDNIDELPNFLEPSKDIVVLDDAIFRVAARDHATKENKSTQKFLTIASHHELFFVITIQNTSLLDISMFQSQDVFMFHKYMDPLAINFERPQFKNKQLIANVHLSKYRQRFPEVHRKAWTYCSTTYEMFAASLPPFWKPIMSKPFYGVIPK